MIAFAQSRGLRPGNKALADLPQRGGIRRLVPILLLAAGLAHASPLDCGGRDSLWFGALEQGEILDTALACRNTGKAPIRLDSVLSSCPCLTAWADKPVLAPGAKTTIHLRLDTEGMRDTVEYPLRLAAGEPSPVRRDLWVRGTVEKLVSAEPDFLDFGDFRRDSVRVFLVGGPAGRRFSIKSATSMRGYVDAKWSPVELVRSDSGWSVGKGGAPGWRVEVTVKSKQVAERWLSEELSLELSGLPQRTLRLRVLGYSP